MCHYRSVLGTSSRLREVLSNILEHFVDWVRRNDAAYFSQSVEMIYDRFRLLLVSEKPTAPSGVINMRNLRPQYRLRIDSMLSSVRPLVWPRDSSRDSMTDSGQSRNKMKSTLTSVITLFHPSRLSLFLGKPSIRNRNAPIDFILFAIAFLIKANVTAHKHQYMCQ